MKASMATLNEIHVYPVKSLRGIRLDSAQLTPLGLAHDRRFMVVREDGRFQTQRDLSALALIDTAISNDGVVLSAPGHGEVLLVFVEEQDQRVMKTEQLVHRPQDDVEDGVELESRIDLGGDLPEQPDLLDADDGRGCASHLSTAPWLRPPPRTRWCAARRTPPRTRPRPSA